jgi:hypothetical protein
MSESARPSPIRELRFDRDLSPTGFVQESCAGAPSGCRASAPRRLSSFTLRGSADGFLPQELSVANVTAGLFALESPMKQQLERKARDDAGFDR